MTDGRLLVAVFASSVADVLLRWGAELGQLRDVLTPPARWIGVMGNPRHKGPHVAALTALGVPPEDIAWVHRPIGLDIGSRRPAEIAVSTSPGCSPTSMGRRLAADMERRPAEDR